MRKTVLKVCLIVISAMFMAYPWISNWLFSRQAGSKVGLYEERLSSMKPDSLTKMLEKAQWYNDRLDQNQVKLTDPFMETEEPAKWEESYDKLLDLGNGLMGFIEIPVIDVKLPIFHGTDTVTLENGIGHLKGSSLPVGGEGTHTVLTGHTGLNKAKLFTDLEVMKEDDLFFIKCAGQVLCYRVFRIQVVEPEETENLTVVPGRDLATLITCTPYGVNSHRLFVTGERTEYTKEVKKEAKKQETRHIDSRWMNTYRNAALTGTFIAIAIIGIHKFIMKKKGRHRDGSSLF
ncbi:MAG: class C sortase [Eubacteriales bacterium]|nr:class C sortase [Eubacteriales bacterium]